MDTFDFEEIAQEIDEIFLTIHNLTTKEQSEHACPYFAKQIFSGQAYSDTIAEIYLLPFEYWTVSYIGNLAHLALKAPIYKKEFGKALEGYREFRISHPELKKPKSILKTTWSDVGLLMWEIFLTFLNEK